MRRILTAVLILASVGCRSDRSGLMYPKSGRPDDPMFSIEEQQRRGRERIATIEDGNSLSPKAYVDRPSPTGR